MLFKFSEDKYSKLKRLEELREKHSKLQAAQKFESEEEEYLSVSFKCLLNVKEIVTILHKLLPETKGEIRNI